MHPTGCESTLAGTVNEMDRRTDSPTKPVRLTDYVASQIVIAGIVTSGIVTSVRVKQDECCRRLVKPKHGCDEVSWIIVLCALARAAIRFVVDSW